MPDKSHEEQVAERAWGNGYLVILHADEYVLADFSDLTHPCWSICDTLAEVEERLADLD